MVEKLLKKKTAMSLALSQEKKLLYSLRKKAKDRLRKNGKSSSIIDVIGLKEGGGQEVCDVSTRKLMIRAWGWCVWNCQKSVKTYSRGLKHAARGPPDAFVRPANILKTDKSMHLDPI